MSAFWVDLSSGISPPSNRPLIAYCPEWCDCGYSIVKWNGSYFECDTHGADIDTFVEKWTIFLEAD